MSPLMKAFYAPSEYGCIKSILKYIVIDTSMSSGSHRKTVILPGTCILNTVPKVFRSFFKNSNIPK